ncbi:hypothetical protein FRC98_06885 [Lujinxingia vulgaris]|uniref:Uncharacterized protein n=1 Tax=Lujinxingia vulgaris TaxID=2600176 RepID=A0A5C6X9T7_9DELT|nr:hypothetical protein [Lujinxingia vulgaris]TXD38601.1 hypothetical protein FRC98_06885 [Lujinxingia vulgaris]
MSLRDRFDEARAGYFASRHRQLRQRGKWADALATLVDEAGWLARHNPTSARWLDLLVEATEVAAQLDDLAEYRAFLNHFADQLLPQDADAEPRVWAALEPLEDLRDTATLEALGTWLTLARPDWPAGPYLEGHALEQSASTSSDLLRAAQAFALAARRAEGATTREGERFRRHCQLRRGALELNMSLNRSAGQTTLGRLNWSEFARAEQLWMAHALTHSERWSDRVRVIDLLLDALRELPSEATSTQGLDDLCAIARELLGNAPLQLHPTEIDRLPELITTLFDATERAHWERHLQARERLQHLVNSPLSESCAAAEVKAALEDLAHNAPLRWQSVAQHAGMLLSAPEQRPDDLVQHTREPIAHFYATLADTLASAERGLPSADLLASLNAAAGALEDEAGALRALALIWPALLDHTSLPPSDACLAELIALARIHARGPSPSYGWWALAAHLYRAGLSACAWPVAQRALQHPFAGEAHDIIYYVKTHTLKEAASREDAASASRWLSLDL